MTNRQLLFDYDNIIKSNSRNRDKNETDHSAALTTITYASTNTHGGGDYDSRNINMVNSENGAGNDMEKRAITSSNNLTSLDSSAFVYADNGSGEAETDRLLSSIMKEKSGGMPLGAQLLMYLVVMSIGAGSMFLLSLDSVVDNLQPVATPFLLNIYGAKEIADYAWEWIVSSRIYGLALGCFVALLLSNCSSRKWPIVGALVLNFSGGVMSGLIVYLPSHFGVILCCVGRFFCGIGCGVAMVVGSAMLAEIPPVHSRGTVLATLTVWSCLGELSGMFISLDTLLGRPATWHIALAIPSLIVPFILIVIVPAPDSPRSLLIAGKMTEALRSLKFYQCSADWHESLADINAEAQSLRQQYARLQARLRHRHEKNRRRFSTTTVMSMSKKLDEDSCDSEENEDGYGLNDVAVENRRTSTKRHMSKDNLVNSRAEDSMALLASNEDENNFSTKILVDMNNNTVDSGNEDRDALSLAAALATAASTRQHQPSICDLIAWRLSTGAFVRPLLLGMFVLTFAHLDDWLWISYSTQIFENVGMSTSAAMRSSLFMSLPQAFISIGLLFCFDGFSRRLLLILPTLGSVCIAMVAVLGLRSAKSPGFDGYFMFWPLKSVIGALASLDLSAAAIASESAYTVMPELFSQTDRVLGSAIVGFTQNFFGGFLTTFALSIINMYGTEFVLIPFMMINLFYVLTLYHCLPETNGKSFHMIAQQFDERLPAACIYLARVVRAAGSALMAVGRMVGVFVAKCSILGVWLLLHKHFVATASGGGDSASAMRFSRALNVFVLCVQFVICFLCIHFGLQMFFALFFDAEDA